MKRFRRQALFALALIPVALIAGLLITLYQLDTLDPAYISETEAQVGGRSMLIVITTAQTVLYAVICGFFGYILAEKLGLMRSLCIGKRPLLITLAVSAPAGVLFSLDPWIFGRFIPWLSATGGTELSPVRFFASVLYGGIIEELMLRLFVMSLIAFIIWKLFRRGSSSVPAGVLTAANIIAALLFAAGHLPATVAMFGALTPAVVLRCFLLNGGFAMIFGALYVRYGIQYAMISHAALHVISQFIWLVFA